MCSVPYLRRMVGPTASSEKDVKDSVVEHRATEWGRGCCEALEASSPTPTGLVNCVNGWCAAGAIGVQQQGDIIHLCSVKNSITEVREDRLVGASVGSMITVVQGKWQQG